MCLVDAILRDYREGVIDRDTAAARLRYLIALNFQHDWVPMPEAYEVVANALAARLVLSLVGGWRGSCVRLTHTHMRRWW